LSVRVINGKTGLSLRGDAEEPPAP